MKKNLTTTIITLITAIFCLVSLPVMATSAERTEINNLAGVIYDADDAIRKLEEEECRLRQEQLDNFKKFVEMTIENNSDDNVFQYQDYFEYLVVMEKRCGNGRKNRYNYISYKGYDDYVGYQLQPIHEAMIRAYERGVINMEKPSFNGETQLVDRMRSALDLFPIQQPEGVIHFNSLVKREQAAAEAFSQRLADKEKN